MRPDTFASVLMIRSAKVLLIATVLACSPAKERPSTAQSIDQRISGEWTSPPQVVPPVQLSITSDGAKLIAAMVTPEGQRLTGPVTIAGDSVVVSVRDSQRPDNGTMDLRLELKGDHLVIVFPLDAVPPVELQRKQ